MALVSYVNEEGTNSCDVSTGVGAYVHQMPPPAGRCVMAPGKNSIKYDMLVNGGGKNTFGVKAFCDAACNACGVDSILVLGECKDGQKLTLLRDLGACGGAGTNPKNSAGRVAAGLIAGLALAALLAVTYLIRRGRRRPYMAI